MRVKSLPTLPLCVLVMAVPLSGQPRAEQKQPPTTLAAYVQGNVETVPKNKAGKLAVTETGLNFTWDKGAQEIPHSRIKTLYLSLSRRSAMAEAFGVYGIPAALAKKRKLLFSIALTEEQGSSPKYVFFLPAAVTQGFLSILEKNSGRKVIFESEEVRKATESQE